MAISGIDSKVARANAGALVTIVDLPLNCLTGARDDEARPGGRREVGDGIWRAAPHERGGGSCPAEWRDLT
jgi:hypothetical protein